MTFEESMEKCNSGMKPSELWKSIITSYQNSERITSESSIPKILHQIWLGSPFPNKYKRLTDLWQELHPDWTVIIWDEKKIDEFGLANRWMYDNMRNPSAKSDVVRYEVAYSYGGVYVDTDFLPCQNFNKLLSLDMFCGMVGSYDGKLVNPEENLAPSIFGCSQGNKLIESLITKIGKETTVPKSISEIMTITGPVMFSREITHNIQNHERAVIFPPTYFYPFPGQQRESIRNLSFEDMRMALKAYTCPETYAMHLWYCSWQKANLL
jgi:mannosyltransferase OCH1-like enzyme